MTRARFASGSKIRITKAPKEAPHLLGKVGEVVYPARVKGGLCCILIGGKFTHLKESDLERVKDNFSLTRPYNPRRRLFHS